MKNLVTYTLLLLVSLSSFSYANSLSTREKQAIKRQENRKKKAIKKRLDQLNWSAFYQDLLQDNNQHFQRLYKRFKNNHIIGLEVIIASSSWSNIESGFGHTMLRFVDNYGTPDDDIVVSFIADVDSNSLNYIKGIFGGYSVFPLFKTLRSFMNDYINTQRRDLDRYIILSTKEIRNNLIDELKNNIDAINKHQSDNFQNVLEKTKSDLLKYAQKKFKKDRYGLIPFRSQKGNLYGLGVVSKDVENSDQKIGIEDIFPLKYSTYSDPEVGSYTFFSNNCAGALVELFTRVGFPYQKNISIGGVVPLALPGYLKKSLINPYPVIKINSLRPLKNKIVEALDLSSTKELKKKLSISQVEVILPILSEKELKQLAEVVRFESDAFYLYEEKLKDFDLSIYADIYGIKSLDKNIYTPCTSSRCAIKSWDILFNNFKEEDLKEAIDESIKVTKAHTIKRVRRKVSGGIYRWQTKDKEIFEGLKTNSEILIHNNVMGFLHENWNKQGVFK